jgi:hypothetical protein
MGGIIIKKMTKSKVPVILTILIILLFSSGPITGSIWQENYVSAQTTTTTTATPIKHLIVIYQENVPLIIILPHIIMQ